MEDLIDQADLENPWKLRVRDVDKPLREPVGGTLELPAQLGLDLVERCRC